VRTGDVDNRKWTEVRLKGVAIRRNPRILEEHRVCADFLAAFFINESQAIDILVSIIESKAMESRY